MSDNTIIVPSLNKLLYGEEMLIKIFGTVDVDSGVLRRYANDLYEQWKNNELVIPHNQGNLVIILKEKRKIGEFKMQYKVYGDNIYVRAEDKSDLIFLKLKYNL